MPDEKPRRQYLTTKRQIRNRLRRAVNKSGFSEEKLNTEVELYMEHVAKKPIERWDLEELARGKPRNKSGGFQGRTPEWITPIIQKEIKRRLHTDTMGLMAKYLPQAIEAVGQIITSEEVDFNGKPIVDAKTRLAAATFVIEHFIGKPVSGVTLMTPDEETKGALVKTFLLPDGAPKHEVVDGSYVVDGEETEYEDDDSEA